MGSCVVAMHAKYIEYSMCNHLNLKRDRERHIQNINSTLIPREREKREREREREKREREEVKGSLQGREVRLLLDEHGSCIRMCAACSHCITCQTCFPGCAFQSHGFASGYGESEMHLLLQNRMLLRHLVTQCFHLGSQ